MRFKKHSHLKVTVDQARRGNPAETRAHFALERTLRAAIADIPRDSPFYDVRSIYERLTTWLHNLRSARQSRSAKTPPASLLFKVTHNNTGYSQAYRSNDSRMEILQGMRSEIRYQRSQRKLPTNRRADTLDYQFMPHRGIKLVPGVFLRAQAARKGRRIFEGKRPRTDDPHIGIELEFVSPLSIADLGGELAAAGLTEFVHLHTDGSVIASDDRPGESAEISILCRQSEVSTMVPRVIAVLESKKCYINKTCGMHVHIDMRKRDQVKAFSQLVRAQPVLYAMCPPSRKDNRYCKPTRGAKLARRHINGERYRGINACALREHNTLEIRIHSGTLSAAKVVNWVDLLVAIVDGKEMKRTFSKPKSLARHLGISETLGRYMAERVEMFAAPSAETNPCAPIDETSETIAMQTPAVPVDPNSDIPIAAEIAARIVANSEFNRATSSMVGF